MAAKGLDRKQRGGSHWTTRMRNRSGLVKAPGDVSLDQLCRDIEKGHEFFFESRGQLGAIIKPEFVPRYGK